MRPPLPRELQALHRYENTVAVDAGERVVTLSENLASLQGASNPAGTASVDNGVVRTAARPLPIPARVDVAAAGSDAGSYVQHDLWCRQAVRGLAACFFCR